MKEGADDDEKYGYAQVGNTLKKYKKYATIKDYTPWLVKKNPILAEGLGELPPCTFGEPIIEFLNKGSTRMQLHIPEIAPSWNLCSDIDYTEMEKGSEYVYTALKNKYRILVYSGDADGSVPTLGTT